MKTLLLLSASSLCRMKDDTYDPLVMIVAVAAVLDVVRIIAGFFAKQPGPLSTGDVKTLLATGLVALHASARRGSALAALVFAEVTDLQNETAN